MKQLPRLPRSETRQTRAQVSFGGYDHRPSCGEGGIYEMQNLTCGDAPLLATRPGRTKVHNVAMGANGLFASSAGLIWCDGNALYHDQSIIQFVTPGPKRIAELCGRVLVWPDKLCYDPAARTITDAAPTWSGAATLADGTYQGESARANTLTAQTDFTFYFRAGDAVTISGCSDAANNGTFIIREISADGKRLVFYEDTFTLPDTSRSEAAVTVTRAIPDLDFVCAWGNRLWGCKDDTVYCTRLGDPLNWYWYDADENGPVSTAAWSVDTGSPGRFTGCAAYRGCVVFTKEDVLYKLYGTKPENFQLVASSLTGAEAASGASFAVADETLFFLAPSGVMATTGWAARSRTARPARTACATISPRATGRIRRTCSCTTRAPRSGAGRTRLPPPPSRGTAARSTRRTKRASGASARATCRRWRASWRPAIFTAPARTKSGCCACSFASRPTRARPSPCRCSMIPTASGAMWARFPRARSGPSCCRLCRAGATTSACACRARARGGC